MKNRRRLIFAGAVSLLLVAAACLWIWVFEDPQCEPCPPGVDCPSCKSELQKMCKIGGMAAFVLSLVLVLVGGRKGPPNR